MNRASSISQCPAPENRRTSGSIRRDLGWIQPQIQGEGGGGETFGGRVPLNYPRQRDSLAGIGRLKTFSETWERDEIFIAQRSVLEDALPLQRRSNALVAEVDSVCAVVYSTVIL